jgi:hypothetical protein
VEPEFVPAAVVAVGLVVARRGRPPASLESWPGDGSITISVPKKSRTCGPAGAILIPGLRGRGKELGALQVRRAGTSKIPKPAPGPGRHFAWVPKPLGAADE